eukprot:4112520-Amphidinium_carterae.1
MALTHEQPSWTACKLTLGCAACSCVSWLEDLNALKRPKHPNGHNLGVFSTAGSAAPTPYASVSSVPMQAAGQPSFLAGCGLSRSPY